MDIYVQIRIRFNTNDEHTKPYMSYYHTFCVIQVCYMNLSFSCFVWNFVWLFEYKMNNLSYIACYMSQDLISEYTQWLKRALDNK